MNYNYYKSHPEILSSFKSRDKIPLICEQCNKIFYRPKNKIQAGILNYKTCCCSLTCSRLLHHKLLGKSSIVVDCKNCGKNFKKTTSAIKKTKNNFCCQSCAAIYNNKNKNTGIKRSKLELWVETNLTKLYPTLKILYNNKSAINSELDIYIPSLKLAFELNGIVHYKPIYGNDKFSQIIKNDNEKIKQCIMTNISLHIIDTSSQKCVNESTSTKFLQIITNIINNKLEQETGF